jgi:hypothetical protein
MYVLVQESGHVVWRKWWTPLCQEFHYEPISTWLERTKFSLLIWWLRIQCEVVASTVISQPTCVAAKLNTIAKIHKYRGLHEGHHFIPTTTEVHNALECDMDCFIKECARLFHNRWSGGHLSLFLHSTF